MKTTAIGKGTIYSIPQKDIEYIGYFYGKNGNENIKSAYSRITKLRGRKPDFFFNAELFDFKSRKATSDVVCGGTVHKLTQNYGIAFPSNKTAVFSYANNVKAKDYVGAYPVLIRNGKAEGSVPSGTEGYRGRTAIGVGSGNLYIALIPDGIGDATLPQLRTGFIKAGATDAINLDGGGSTQYYTPNASHYTGRALRGFVGVWLKKSGDIRYVSVRTSLNIREKPSILSKRIGKLYNGDSVIVLEEKNGWARAAYGWVSSAYLKKAREL